MSISSILNKWYLEKKRDLPWRNTKNPYHIWVSEIILQQTKVNQGLSYYNRFIEYFPDIKSLATADIEVVLKLWQGLGYYARAHNIHEGAGNVLQYYNGKLPDNYKELLTIKGIGDYTASAIASIAFGQPHAVIDGNVKRVIARIFGINEPINSGKGEKQIKTIAWEIMDKVDPGTHNQAIMEFGAMQCIPKNPSCKVCPIANICFAFNHKMVEQIPVKIKKEKIRIRYFYYVLVYFNRHILIKKRDGDDIWNGLFEFPLIELKKQVNSKQLLNTKEWENIFNNTPITIFHESKVYSHQLSHQTIKCIFIKLKIEKLLPNMNGYQIVDINDFHKYPISRLIDRYIEENGI